MWLPWLSRGSKQSGYSILGHPVVIDFIILDCLTLPLPLWNDVRKLFPRWNTLFLYRVIHVGFTFFHCPVCLDFQIILAFFSAELILKYLNKFKSLRLQTKDILFKQHKENVDDKHLWPCIWPFLSKENTKIVHTG